MSYNAAFSLLASWAVRIAGVPVKYVVCQRGMQQCMLGTQRTNLAASPPCARCIQFSNIIYPRVHVLPLKLEREVYDHVFKTLQGMSLSGLTDWEMKGYKLGKICLPSLRWALRRHHLIDEEPIRTHFRFYLASASSLVNRFEFIYNQLKPSALVIFNGITFPEAIAREVAITMGIPVITHEVGLRPLSAFFSHEHATFREVDVLEEYSLSDDENHRLDSYLEARWSGNFTMAGIRFWPGVQPLPEKLLERLPPFKQMVAIFTNVVFDTSQVHANTIYPHMFAWLDDVKQTIEKYQDTLFVIRAHPDEDRPGKESQESVADWIQNRDLQKYPNVEFISPTEYISSYELVRKAKFIMVYNSSIGLEASIMGWPVLCAGRARYTQIPIAFFPPNRKAYKEKLEALLQQDEIKVDEEFVRNARSFLYYELYHASLDFSRFMEPYTDAPGNALLSSFDPRELETTREIETLRCGILEKKPFVV
jgi:hypothetical protein